MRVLENEVRDLKRKKAHLLSFSFSIIDLKKILRDAGVSV